MTIGKKLVLSAAALFIGVLGLAVSSLNSLAQVSHELETATGLTSRKLAIAGNIKAGANGMRTGQRGLLLNSLQHDNKGLEATRKDYGKRHKEVVNLIAELRPLLAREQDRAVTGVLEHYVAQHASYFQQISDLCEAGDVVKASLVYREHGAPAGVGMEKTATELMGIQAELMAESASDGRLKATSARRIAIFISLLALGMVGMLYAVQRDITRRLQGLAVELNEGAEQIAAASGQLCSASETLAQGASKQAASIEQTSAGAQEFKAVVQESAERSRTAADLMGTAETRAGDVNRALDQMVKSMQGITSSSDHISKIIKVIDGIAFQTNILALNAAVEAARAGEAGMGFAVVADEVRNLAQRSAQAAKDTASLIEESISKSNDGEKKLKQVADVVRSVIEVIEKVKTLADELKLASQRENTGISEIAKAIGSMEQVTQSNASSAEETASASEKMQLHSEALRVIVGQLQAMAGGK